MTLAGINERIACIRAGLMHGSRAAAVDLDCLESDIRQAVDCDDKAQCLLLAQAAVSDLSRVFSYKQLPPGKRK